MARSVAGFLHKGDFASRTLGSHSGFANFINPAGRVLTNVSEGKPITTRSLLDPAGAVLVAPPPPPPAPPTFPDVEGAQIAARRNVRRRGVSGGVGSTILTSGYSPTGQAAGSLGGV